MRVDDILGRTKNVLPTREARLLLAHVLGLRQEDLWARPETQILDPEVFQFEELLARRLKGEPLSKIRGYKEFWSHEFITSSAVLDPRPDSETIIEAALKYFPDRQFPLHILDFGTGSGCLLLTLLAEYPNSWGLGVDISPLALNIARQNARNLNISANFIQSNWGEALNGQFDLIISNPPYIKSADIPELGIEVRDFDPLIALDGGKDGLSCYKQLSLHLPRLLKPHGIGILEIGYGQDISQFFSIKEIVPDLAGIPRAIII